MCYRMPSCGHAACKMHVEAGRAAVRRPPGKRLSFPQAMRGMGGAQSDRSLTVSWATPGGALDAACSPRDALQEALGKEISEARSLESVSTRTARSVAPLAERSDSLQGPFTPPELRHTEGGPLPAARVKIQTCQPAVVVWNSR